MSDIDSDDNEYDTDEYMPDNSSNEEEESDVEDVEDNM